MKKTVTVILVLLFLALSFGIVHADQVLKDFTLTTIDGTTIAFNDLKGKPLVINIGGHW
jgi:cytochrome oxidase Cu insertion factor (SCO1/SenC/PrrC family)